MLCKITLCNFFSFEQILISILLNWLLCGILTSLGVFTDDPKNIEYRARTDARSDVISTSPWFTFPYPGLYRLSQLWILQHLYIDQNMLVGPYCGLTFCTFGIFYAFEVVC